MTVRALAQCALRWIKGIALAENKALPKSNAADRRERERAAAQNLWSMP